LRCAKAAERRNNQFNQQLYEYTEPTGRREITRGKKAHLQEHSGFKRKMCPLIPGGSPRSTHPLPGGHGRGLLPVTRHGTMEGYTTSSCLALSPNRLYRPLEQALFVLFFPQLRSPLICELACTFLVCTHTEALSCIALCLLCLYSNIRTGMPG
jgi:hypothetical protein